MISAFFRTVFYEPLYNGLISLINILPEWADVGIAVILFTIIVRLALFPLSRQSVKTQVQLKEIEPELNSIKEKYKDRQEQARKTLELYREKNIRPFAGFFLVLIQIPIVITLYRIFYTSHLPEIQTDLLYSFVAAPEQVSILFLGFIDITSKNIILAALAGVAQYFQVRYSMPAPKAVEKPTFKDDLARSMHMQMKYIMPVVIAFFAYTASAAIALYLITSSAFMIVQELYIRRTYKR